MMPEQHYQERRRDSLSKEDIEEILDRLSGLERAFGECRDRINARVEERIGEHHAIRDMRAQIDHLSESIDYLKGAVSGAITNGDERLKDHDVDIEELRQRVSALEATVAEILSKISQIEHIARSNTEVINNWGSQIMRSQSALHDTVNLALAQSSTKQSPTIKQAAKMPVAWFYAGLPTLIYAVITLAHYVKTGNVILLGGG